MSNLNSRSKFTSVVITWNPPQEPNGLIISYEITYVVNGSSIITNTTGLRTFTITSLMPQSIIPTISVSAYTRKGRGESATLENVTTLSEPCEFMWLNKRCFMQIYIFCSHGDKCGS